MTESDELVNGSCKQLFYYKRSMTPTFAPGDVLTIVPYAQRSVRRGDVIVFSSPQGGDLISHRVIEVSNEGIVTCGDSIMSGVDPWMLRPEDIVGCVTAVERKGRERQVWGGSVGLAYHRIRRRHARLDRVRRRIMYGLIRAIDLGRWLSGVRLWALLPARSRPRVLAVRRPRGQELLLLMGRGIIGRHVPGGHLWSIRYVYLPFVDKAFLRRAVEEFGER
ncbi:MAG: hypothetical protein MUE60_00105 [Candidatus Eisenbacteria bacterium]|jgi:signal peptidase I|nr:hypothetical protein [Candidatus Eisenbacteria bacterium]